MTVKEKLAAFIETLKNGDRWPDAPPEVLSPLNGIEVNPNLTLPTGTILYRARIKDGDCLIRESPFEGFGKEESGAPPSYCAKAGRANPEGISYLYCARDKFVAISEIRPSLTDIISVAEIKVVKELSILDLTKPFNIEYEEKADLIDELNLLFSKPIRNNESSMEYIATQFIASYIKKLGYHGIAYKSACLNNANIDNPINVAIFYPNCCEAISSQLYKVSYIDIKSEPIGGGTEISSIGEKR